MENRKITKITYHYLTEEYSSISFEPVRKYKNPCLNIFYNNWWGRKMVLMVNPTWNEIKFITEKEYWKRCYKGGFTLKQGLWEIPKISKGYRTDLILNHFVHWLGLEKKLDV